MEQLPLTGYRILALEHFIAAPLGTMWLADAGAEVIKIEPPGTGEAGRLAAPITTERGQTAIGILRNSRNKLSVTLDLKSEPGQDIFKRLVASADAVVNNLSAGVMDRLGLGYEALREVKPDLIYVAVSGFGQASGGSPYADWPAYDIISQAMAGLMLRAGQKNDPPLYNGLFLADQVTSMLAAYSVLLGLIRRERSGRGQSFDLAMYDAALSLNDFAVTLQALTGQRQPRGGFDAASPFGAYRARDGYLVVAAVTLRQWSALCDLIGRPDLNRPDLDTGAKRYQKADQVIRAAIEDWAVERPVRAAVAALIEAGVPAGPVQDVEEILACPHVAARRMLVEVDDPVVGRYRALGNPIKMPGLPDPPNRPAPALGEHTDQVLARLAGLTPEEIAELRARKVV